MIPEAADPANHLPQGIKPHLLHERINGWFMQNARDLPWRRDDCSPWGVMVSEFMLQQTPVKRVLPVWEEWMRRWPTPADLRVERGDHGARCAGLHREVPDLRAVPRAGCVRLDCGRPTRG